MKCVSHPPRSRLAISQAEIGGARADDDRSRITNQPRNAGNAQVRLQQVKTDNTHARYLPDRTKHVEDHLHYHDRDDRDRQSREKGGPETLATTVRGGVHGFRPESTAE